MDCFDATSNLQLFIDEELDSADAQRLETHLGGCPGCRTRFESEKFFKQTLREKITRRAAAPALAENLRHLVLQHG